MRAAVVTIWLSSPPAKLCSTGLRPNYPAASKNAPASCGRGSGDIAAAHPGLRAELRGRGLIQGLYIPEPGLAECIAGSTAFAHGLMVETAGADSDVIKVMPALTIEAEDLAQGLEILKAAVAEQLDQRTTISRRS